MLETKASATHEHKSSEKTAATLAINQTLASDVKHQEQQTSTTTAASTVPGFKKISSNFTSFIDDLLQVNALHETTKAPLVLSTSQITTTIKSTSTNAPIKSILNDDDFIKKHLSATSTSTSFSKSSSQSQQQPNRQMPPAPSQAVQQQMEIFSKPTNPTMNGLLKLAGCNIYGQMYDVGHVIAELSNPCYECKCLPDIGVGCMPLC